MPHEESEDPHRVEARLLPPLDEMSHAYVRFMCGSERVPTIMH